MPETFTGSQDCAGVLGLVYIFQDDCDIPGPEIQYPFKPFPAAFSDKA